MDGSLNAAPASSLAMPSWALCMSGVWKAPATASGTMRDAPASSAAAVAACTASTAPPMLTLPGAFSLQTAAPCSAQIAATWSRSRPSTAAIVPGVTSHASCISSPRRCTRRMPSSKLIAPAAISAAYSPSECPATTAGRLVIVPASMAATRAAMPWATSAGCVLTVRVSSSSGPSKQRPESEKPRASSAASKTARAAGISSWRSLPMPTCCAPCPGKSQAWSAATGRSGMVTGDMRTPSFGARVWRRNRRGQYGSAAHAGATAEPSRAAPRGLRLEEAARDREHGVDVGCPPGTGRSPNTSWMVSVAAS